MVINPRGYFTIATVRIIQLQILSWGLSQSSATQLTYDDCMSDTTAQSYRVGGWCFLFKFPGWFAGNPGNTQSSITNAQSYCGPNGVLAVGVTYKLQQIIATQMLVGQSTNIAFMALLRNSSYSNHLQGWQWSTKLPNGTFSNFPAIWSNVYWGALDPDNFYAPEDGSVVVSNYGGADIQSFYALGTNMTSAGVVCQFAPVKWSFTRRGTGRFSAAAYLIKQASYANLYKCALQCHNSYYCVALSYNEITTDCQIYAVSPQDPRFAASVTADSSYNSYIRDGMVY